MYQSDTAADILGYVSLLTWLIVGFPQFYELYRTKSGEAMSIPFLAIWGVGDIFNIIGCILTGQLMTQLLVAVWYTIMDGTLISQIYYYDYFNPHLKYEVEGAAEQIGDEEDALLGATGGPTMAQKMPRRRSTFTDMSPDEQLASSFETAPRGYIHQTRRPSTHSRKSAQNQSQSLFMSALPLVLVPFLVLALSSGVLEADHNTWGRVPYPGGVGRTLMGQSASNEGGGVCIGTPLECAIGLVLGWASSVLYVVSRIPQLYKNYVRKSCEGLSVWMFFFGVIGNLTYSLSIFVKSTEADYLLNSLPYIIGSIGTLGFDLTIFLQFFLYNNAPAGGYDVIN